MERCYGSIKICKSLIVVEPIMGDVLGFIHSCPEHFRNTKYLPTLAYKCANCIPEIAALVKEVELECLFILVSKTIKTYQMAKGFWRATVCSPSPCTKHILFHICHADGIF